MLALSSLCLHSLMTRRSLPTSPPRPTSAPSSPSTNSNPPLPPPASPHPPRKSTSCCVSSVTSPLKPTHPRATSCPTFLLTNPRSQSLMEDQLAALEQMLAKGAAAGEGCLPEPSPRAVQLPGLPTVPEGSDASLSTSSQGPGQLTSEPSTTTQWHAVKVWLHPACMLWLHARAMLAPVRLASAPACMTTTPGCCHIATSAPRCLAAQQEAEPAAPLATHLSAPKPVPYRNTAARAECILCRALPCLLCTSCLLHLPAPIPHYTAHHAAACCPPTSICALLDHFTALLARPSSFSHAQPQCKLTPARYPAALPLRPQARKARSQQLCNPATLPLAPSLSSKPSTSSRLTQSPTPSADPQAATTSSAAGLAPALAGAGERQDNSSLTGQHGAMQEETHGEQLGSGVEQSQGEQQGSGPTACLAAETGQAEEQGSTSIGNTDEVLAGSLNLGLAT
ncbi:hypothetical protein HaLaN_02168 [Haematococcus lacustris]|uniref:Uncharacterized protein n=1 Tax=Haematococcus lacustris TaxID=44745 RepID=A0A699YMS4_HAELA|nr:hypothetical protein HaLaN_02168 [Haematococcus lacustris]